jgi:hypothetical protein
MKPLLLTCFLLATVSLKAQTITATLEWGTYFGGDHVDQAWAVTKDHAGNIYMAGKTASTTHIATAGAHQTVYAGAPGGGGDAFLAKFTPAGGLLWATYYGGNDIDEIRAVVCDDSGNVYATGFTSSASGIATAGSYQSTYGGSEDAFLAKFSSAGVLIWSTYYGAGQFDAASAIVFDSTGFVYISGNTYSADSIATPGSYQSTYTGLGDAFLAKFTRNGLLQWATYYGGSGSDWVNGMVIDNSRNICIAGNTTSSDHIATTGGYQATPGGSIDAFVAKFSSNGSLTWGTYFGGSGGDIAYDITKDGSDNLLVTGYTTSATAIATPGSYQSTYAGSSDAFLSKFNSTGSLIWSTYYGGDSTESGAGVVCDKQGNVYITGGTHSANGIATTDAYQLTYGGGVKDAFLSVFNSSGNRIWATYYGGPVDEGGEGIIFDDSANVYLTGATTSATGISAGNTYQPVYGTSDDAFLAKFGPFSSIAEDADSRKISVPAFCIYPNPAKEKVRIRAGDGFESKIVSLYDLAGRLLQQVCSDDQVIELVVNDYAPGIYLLSVKTDAAIASYRLQID